MQDEKARHIYVVFASTRSYMGRLIRLATHYEYNHVAIAMSKDLDTLYSFARYNKDSALVGGFVEESALRYFYKNGQAANIRVYDIPVTEEQYTHLEDKIEYIKKNSHQYIYNTFSAMVSPFGARVRIYRAYTCVEFVAELLAMFKIVEGLEQGNSCTIEGMEGLLKEYLVYEGSIYAAANVHGWGADQYIKRNSMLKSCRRTIGHFGRLIRRAVRSY